MSHMEKGMSLFPHVQFFPGTKNNSPGTDTYLGRMWILVIWSLSYSLWRGNHFAWLCFLCCRRQQKYGSRYLAHSKENLTKNSWNSHLYRRFLQQTWSDKSQWVMNPSLPLHSSLPQTSKCVLTSVFPVINSQVTKQYSYNSQRTCFTLQSNLLHKIFSKGQLHEFYHLVSHYWPTMKI